MTCSRVCLSDMAYFMTNLILLSFSRPFGRFYQQPFPHLRFLLTSLGLLFCFFISLCFSTLVLANHANAQKIDPDFGSLSPEELLLDPDRLEAGEGGVIERWRAIRSFLEKGLQNFERGKAHVSMTRALLQTRGWQEAQSYAQSINEPIWRARSLLAIAAVQFKTRNGRSFGIKNLEEAFSILRSIPSDKLGKDGEQGFRIVGEMFAQQGFFQRVSSYIQSDNNIRARARFIEGALPHLPRAAGLAREEQDSFINKLLIRATQQSELEDLLRLSDYSIRSGRVNASNRLLFEAYRRALLLPPGEQRNNSLVQVATHMLSNGTFRDALRAIRRIENPYLQSGLLAETGRRMIQAKMSFAGQPLMSLANDIALTLDTEQKRSALLRLSIEYALSGDFAVAWDVLQDIEDLYQRSRGILALSFVLSESEDVGRALEIQEFIPDANLRAKFITHAARQIAEGLGPQELTDLIINLVESDDFAQGQGDNSLSPENVEGLLEAQLAFGNGRRNKILFERTFERTMAQNQSLFSRLRAELRFLRIDARRSERQAQAAQERIESLLISMWVYHNEPEYPQIVESAVEFFITQNNLTRAFTIVESLAKEKYLNQQSIDETHDRLLSTIAFQAARRANEGLALRAIASVKQKKEKSNSFAKIIDIAANIP